MFLSKRKINIKKDYKLCDNWFVINGKITHHEMGCVNGKRLSIKETYEWEKDKLKLLYN